jgi:hypothetical protein
MKRRRQTADDYEFNVVRSQGGKEGLELHLLLLVPQRLPGALNLVDALQHLLERENALFV